MFSMRQIDKYIWALMHNNKEMFRSSKIEVERALEGYKKASEPVLVFQKWFHCDGIILYRVPGTGYWYTTDLDVADAQFDIRTVCSYLVAGCEFPEPRIRERVLSMTHAEIFREAFKRNLIRFVGAYVVPIRITINYGGMK